MCPLFLSRVQLREDFDMGVDVQLDEEHSVHDVAALLKEFLRDMPDPLLPRELYPAFLHANREHGHTRASGTSPVPVVLTASSFSAKGSRAAPVPAAPPVHAASLQLRHAAAPPQPLAHGAELRPGHHRNK